MKRIASIAVLLTLTIGLYAQERDSRLKNTIDIGIGPTLSAANIDEFDGKKAFATGTSLSYRYTRHFGEHWGVFAQADVARNKVFEKPFFKRLESIEGGRYTYSAFNTGKAAPFSSYLGAFVGAQYIIDKGGFSLRPRAGIGIAEYNSRRYRYYKWDVYSSGITPEAVMSFPQDNDEETETIGMGIIVPAVKAGIQAKWYVTDILHLGVDVELTGFAASTERFTETWRTTMREPGSSSVIIGILTLGTAENYLKQEKISTSVIKHVLPPVGSIRFSIGWDL